MPDEKNPEQESANLETAASFNYILSARNIISKTQFGEEIGNVTYLKVPKGELATPQYEIDKQDWVLEVRDIADSIADHTLGPTGDVLVFVHGYNNSAETIRDRHEILQEYLAVEGWGVSSFHTIGRLETILSTTSGIEAKQL